MADHHPSAGDADSSGGLWPAIRKLFDLDGGERSLRAQLEETLDEAEQDAGEDAQAQFDASFSLMMLTLVEFIPALLEALGGEEIPQGI